MDWEALDAEGIAEFEQSLREALIVQLPPSGPYYKGDPRFWGSNLLDINWKDNAAESVVDGAYARGIKVPLARLRELLPAGSHENEEAAPRQVKPAEPKKDPKDWLAWARKEYPKQRNEKSTDYIRRLHGLMEKADNVTEVWGYETLRVRWYEALRADRHATPFGEPE
jgi:hypothetical protein